MPTPPPWTLLLGGPPRLQARDGSELALEGIECWVLAWLALEGPVPRARLMTLLWPGDDPGTVLRNRLRQRLFALKRRIGVEVVAGVETLALGPAVHWPGPEALGDDSLLLDPPPAGGTPDLLERLASWRERQHALRRERLATDAAALEREGRLAEALVVAERRVQFEPLQEHAHRQVMRLHHLRSDRAAAIAAFERCERLLKDELGVRPGPETLALLAQVEAAVPPPAVAARPVLASLLRPPRLVGREAEWRRLGDAWAQRLPVVVVGEGGLGKSRLLADALAAQSAPVLHVAARPGDASMPLRLVARVLRALPPVAARSLPAGTLRELARLLPELGDAPPAAHDAERRLQQAVGSAVQACEGLFALVLDDLHLADGASLELLCALLSEPGPVWAAALRPGPQAPALQAFLHALLGGGQAVQLVLQPLTLEAIAEFCDSLALPGLEGFRWAPPLLQRTGGNPQYMLEILKAWWLAPASAPGSADATLQALPTPVSLPRLVSQRIETLSRAAIDLARCAAVAGEDFSPELAAAVLHLRPVDLADPWAELEAARVFDGDRFAHDLIAEAARASVPAPVARALHAQVAAALQQHVRPRTAEPARLAHHWHAAGRWTESASAFEAAAQRCGERGRRADEADAWHRAADDWQLAGMANSRFEALARRTEVLVQYGGGAPASEALEALATEIREPAQQRRVDRLRLAHAQHTGDFETTLRLAPAVIDDAWADDGPRAALRPLLVHAGALAKRFRGNDAVALLERVRPWVEGSEAGDEDRREFWNAMAIALDFANRFGEALSAWRQTQHYARCVGSDLLSQALGNEGFTLQKMGRMVDAVERGREALRLELEHGDRLGAQTDYLRLALGHHLRCTGELGEAQQLLQQALDGMRTRGSEADAIVAANALAVAWVHLGQPDRAHRVLAGDSVSHLPPRLQLMRDCHHVMVAHALGERRAAEEAVRIAAGLDADDPESLPSRVAVLLLGPALPPERAEAQALQAVGWFAARGRMGLALAAHVVAGTAALAQDAVDRAQAHVQAANELGREYQPDIVYGAQRFWLAERVRHRLGRPDAEGSLLPAARRWIRERAAVMAPELQSAFLQRQPFNAALLRWSKAND